MSLSKSTAPLPVCPDDSCKTKAGTLKMDHWKPVMSSQQAPGDGLEHGAGTYSRVLAAEGGVERETLTRGEDRNAIHVGVYVSPPYELTVPPLRVARLSINMTRARVSGGLEGSRPRSFDARRHSLFLTPPGAAVAWRKEAPSCHLNIFFHQEIFDKDETGATWLTGGEPMFNFEVKGIGELADELIAELRGSGALAIEAVDSLSRLLLIKLARRSLPCVNAHNPLTSKVLAKLHEYVMEHLSERILVSDLAKQVDLSANHFAQLFSEKTEQSPHQFVIRLRIERATELLRRSKASLSDIAQACGFANQQHFSNTMRRRLGTTPGCFREMRRNDDDC